MKLKLSIFLFVAIIYSCLSQKHNKLQPKIIIVQPIVVQSDEGTNPALMALPEYLVDRAYQKAKVDFHFLEPIYYNNTKARDGEINLDEIVKASQENGLLKGQGDIVNMFFVNAIDGNKGPLGRGIMGGYITFIVLGENSDKNIDELKNMQAFVIAHEVGHNLSLKHAIDDPNVSDSLPNIQSSGAFKDRIDPKNSLNDYQIGVVHKSPLVHSRIEFLSKKEGKEAILDESFEPYFSQLQKREIAAFVQEKVTTESINEVRQFAKDKFASAVTDFTKNEKKCITYVTNKVNEILQKNNISLMANHPWRFIKIEDWLCGGFAHTRGTYIILSQKHINHLTKEWSDQMTPEEEETLIKKLGGLLVHEQMHSLQRTYKTKFLKLYTNYWNFVNANVLEEKPIQINQVSNPDAPIAEWLIPNKKDKNTYFWIRTLLKEGSDIPVMGKDFVDTVFTVQKVNNVFSVKKDSNNKLMSSSLSEISFYSDSFPVKRGLDHPNEISAYMFSEYFKVLISDERFLKKVSPKASDHTTSFINWINKEMKE
ncbi:zinc-dependent metalloprotease family protein [Aquimarina sp. AU58]|uniref:zinc-dependent metalloprotease family protein n=1 Tax=Aquimarina sp. AU58 TaxID=1874112 RepID=UPI000D6E7C98|nr:zinc-dependent metalloprotease family protein [Aquimarina sp. AU58]